NMTQLANPSNGVLKVLYFSSSFLTHVWKYASLRSILLLYFALPIALRICFWFGIWTSSLTVLLFCAVRSTSSLILPSVLGCTKRGAAPGVSVLYITPSCSFLSSQFFNRDIYRSGTV